MMSFKELVEQDNKNVFMNLDEFADTHVIGGKEMPCIIDNNEMIDREKRYQYKRSLYADGVYLKEVLLYVKAEDFGPLPAVGRLLTLDKKSYIVSDAIDEGGIYSISLEANKT
mgnify:FL=1